MTQNKTLTDEETIRNNRTVQNNEVIDTTAPEKIWLVIGEEGNYQDSTGGFDEICWCEDKQGDNDVKYIRADLAKQETAKDAWEEAASICDEHATRMKEYIAQEVNCGKADTGAMVCAKAISALIEKG